jgi:pimeloyl-ACP methyl ester carboxylesterase
MQIDFSVTDRAIPGNYWQWQEHSIYYVRAGAKSDRPPLLLVHGFGASTDHWRKNIAQLQQEFQVWAIDLLGFGRSAKPDLEYSGNLWREQLHDFIIEVIGSPVILAGNSLGGYASLCVAAAYPQEVAGLILLNSAGPFSDTQPQKEPSAWQKLIRSILQQPWASYLLFQYVRRPSTIRKTLEKVYLDRTTISDRLIEEIYRPSCDRGAAQVFAAIFKIPPGEKVDILLQQMNCPLLLLWGEADPWLNAKTRSQQFYKYYDRITEYYLKAGHCPHDEIPERVNRLIRDWVLSVKDGNSSLLTS